MVHLGAALSIATSAVVLGAVLFSKYYGTFTFRKCYSTFTFPNGWPHCALRRLLVPILVLAATVTVIFVLALGLASAYLHFSSTSIVTKRHADYYNARPSPYRHKVHRTGGGGDRTAANDTARSTPTSALVSKGFNSICIADVCVRSALSEHSCVIEQELECISWMNQNSDCFVSSESLSASGLHRQTSTGQALFHTIWVSGPLTRVAKLMVKSFLVTQRPDRAQLIIWTMHAPESVLFGDPPFDDTVRRQPQRVLVRKFSIQDTWDSIRKNFTGLPPTVKLPAHDGAVFMSDLMRLFLLYQYGGVYVDMDTMFLREMTPLLHKAPFVYGWGCIQDYVNTAVMGMEAHSTAAFKLLDSALDRIRQKFRYVQSNPILQAATVYELTTTDFHPYLISKYIHQYDIDMNVLSAFLVDPIWNAGLWDAYVQHVGENASGTPYTVEAPCLHLRSFNPLFQLPVDLSALFSADGFTLHSNVSQRETTDLPVCYPAFTLHWHNNWRAPLIRKSAMFQIETFLHVHLDLPPPIPEHFSKKDSFTSHVLAD
jgi:hypothetical protein